MKRRQARAWEVAHEAALIPSAVWHAKRGSGDRPWQRKTRIADKLFGVMGPVPPRPPARWPGELNGSGPLTRIVREARRLVAAAIVAREPTCA